MAVAYEPANQSGFTNKSLEETAEQKATFTEMILKTTFAVALLINRLAYDICVHQRKTAGNVTTNFEGEIKTQLRHAGMRSLSES
jgi:hypothetical protein